MSHHSTRMHLLEKVEPNLMNYLPEGRGNPKRFNPKEEAMEIDADIGNPENCANQIYECSGHMLEPQLAKELWPKILQHKWFLSQKVERDVGIVRRRPNAPKPVRNDNLLPLARASRFEQASCGGNRRRGIGLGHLVDTGTCRFNRYFARLLDTDPATPIPLAPPGVGLGENASRFVTAQ